VFSRFFIDRPIFASVMSIVITLTGAVAAFNLPVAQYPQITPPSIVVSCNYPGASAEVVAESVAAPIEQQVNGVEDMIYMSSQSGNDGSYSLSVTFKPGVNLNFAQVLVQNRVNLALPLLPDVVKQAGVTTRKRNPDILLIVSVYSEDDPETGKPYYDQLFLSNYATLKLTDELLRVDGVGDCFNFGQQDYSMRIWVDPDRLASLELSAFDVVNALREQNMQFASGQVGQPPARARQPFELTVHTLGRLSEPEQFADIVLRVTADGRKVCVKDVVQETWTDTEGHTHRGVELGPRNMDQTSKIDGHPCTSLAVFQLPYANALTVRDNVQKRMDALAEDFPAHVRFAIAYDTTPVVKESIAEVFQTLGVAVGLVALVVLVFLQNWRSTIIPLTAVPVAIVGTFAAMAAIGFSLNNLTLFGLVLAIGIVVDDAIVVVEAVEHHIEEGMAPRQAAYKAMEQVSGPVVAVALVLSAVFIPCAFIAGITGQFFRQFALTIAVSTVISAFNSLTLSPALAALLLKKRGARKDLLGRLLDLLFGWFFRLFNWGFRKATDAYTRAVGLALRGSVVVLLLYGGLLALTWVGFNGLQGLVPPGLPGLSAKWAEGRKVGSFDVANGLPTGYIPNQDQGRLMVSVQLPDAAALARTQKIVDRVAEIAHETNGCAHTITLCGRSYILGANGPNFGNLFITLQEFDERRGDKERSADAVAKKLQARLNDELGKQAVLKVLGPPPVSGLGSTGGFKFIVEDRSGDNDLKKLEAQTKAVISNGSKDPKLTGLFTVFQAESPQLFVDVNRDQCQAMGVNPRDVFTTLQVYLGSLYVNDFNKYGRTWQVVVQAQGEFRNDVAKISRLKVRSTTGAMVPLGAVLTVRPHSGPLVLMRYNMYPAAAVVGNTAAGVSSGEGIRAVQDTADKTLPQSMSYEWTEINWIQIDAARNVWNNLIFPFAVVFVFLVLAAQYESWALPLAVILVVPMCLLGSLTGVALANTDVNIFTQIGFVVLVGLASKNAILIVEFAKHQREDAGRSRTEATLAAVRLRLRPILMTSFAFILGVLPLIMANGAGAEMRRALGVAVFSGMLGVTLFGIFLTPVFFYVIEGFIDAPLFSGAAAGPSGVPRGRRRHARPGVAAGAGCGAAAGAGPGAALAGAGQRRGPGGRRRRRRRARRRQRRGARRQRPRTRPQRRMAGRRSVRRRDAQVRSD
jgi:multidrug efflux pump